MIIGIDEVGRGSLCGPLVVGCVSLKKNKFKFKDSKKLTKSQRISAYNNIMINSKFHSVGYVWPYEIDKLGLSKATAVAILRALGNIDILRHQILIDGSYNFLGLKNVKTIIKGDSLNQDIAAASILAKVTRDKLMSAYATLYSNYLLEKNMGYGTKEHYLKIFSNGLSPIHRLSFLKKLEISL